MAGKRTIHHLEEPSRYRQGAKKAVVSFQRSSAFRQYSQASETTMDERGGLMRQFQAQPEQNLQGHAAIAAEFKPARRATARDPFFFRPAHSQVVRPERRSASPQLPMLAADGGDDDDDDDEADSELAYQWHVSGFGGTHPFFLEDCWSTDNADRLPRLPQSFPTLRMRPSPSKASNRESSLALADTLLEIGPSMTSRSDSNVFASKETEATTTPKASIAAATTYHQASNVSTPLSASSSRLNARNENPPAIKRVVSYEEETHAEDLPPQLLFPLL